MRTALLLPLLLALPALPALPAQRLIHGMNEYQECREMTGVKDWFCLSTQAPPNQALMVIAIEFPIKVKSGPFEFALYDQDSAGKPGNQLAYGQIPGSPLPIWQGGLLGTPVLIKPGQPFFVAQKNVGGDLSIVKAGTNVPYYYRSGTNWNGPFSSYPWGFRLYTGGGAGTYAPYGTAKSDPAGSVSLRGIGYPNIGNPVGLLMETVPASGVPVLLLGRHHPGLPTGPLGTLYVFPSVFLFAPPLNPIGFSLHNLNIPTDPVLVGATVAWQGWVVLPAAAGGALHTAGLDMLL